MTESVQNAERVENQLGEDEITDTVPGAILVSLSKPSHQIVETDQRTAQVQKRLMDVIPPLVADSEPTILGKPGQCPLHHPPVPAQLLRAFHAFSGYASFDASLSQRLRALLVVVGFVGVQLLGTLPRAASARTLDGFDRVQKLLEDHRIMNVGCSEHHCQWDAVSV